MISSLAAKWIELEDIVLSHKSTHRKIFKWCPPVIPAFERLRQEDSKFKASLGYIGRPSFYLRKKKKDKHHIFSITC
jgi:hypothetical protein